MVSYCGGGYRLWNPKTNEIIETRDVHFNELDYRYKENERMPYISYEDEEENEQSTSKDSDTEPCQTSNREETSDTGEDCEINENSRMRRVVQKPKRYQDYDMSNMAYALDLMQEDPISYQQAIKEEEWSDANGQSIIQELKKEFQGKDMGNISKFLGMEITRTRERMVIKQTQIIEIVLLRFTMQNC